MDFGRAFSHATQDPNWLQKVGIAAAIMLIPFLGWITVFGWGLEITRRVITNDPQTLPDWSNFMDHFVRGIKGFVVSFAFSLPSIVFSGCRGIFQAFATNPSLFGNSDSSTASMLASAISIFVICLSCVSAILSLASSFVMPAALGNMMANNGDLGAAFRFNEVFGLVRAAVGPFLMTLLGALIVGVIIPFGLIACIIGVFFTAAWGTTVISHLYGQAYNAGKAAMNVQPMSTM